MIPDRPKSINLTWPAILQQVLKYGENVSPRGHATLEIPQHTAIIDMRKPVLVIPERKLSTKFLGGEAFWILSGDDRVETIAPYNKNIAQFSDDGVTFYGAYGPRIMGQLDYVVNKLIEDRLTRQAFLTIWQPNPPKTKDVPCTVTCGFMIRDGELNCYVYMRSNDLWLGFPYDVFNFSMLAHLICCRLNKAGIKVKPGVMYHTAASRHLYEQHFDIAREIGTKYNVIAARLSTLDTVTTIETPEYLYEDEEVLMNVLNDIRENGNDSRLIWWK